MNEEVLKKLSALLLERIDQAQKTILEDILKTNDTYKPIIDQVATSIACITTAMVGSFLVGALDDYVRLTSEERNSNETTTA